MNRKVTMKLLKLVLPSDRSYLVWSGPMKKLMLSAIAVACSVSVFAQGYIVFQNRNAGTWISHVYFGSTAEQTGNGPDDFPVGTTDWTGYAALAGSGWVGFG